MSQAVADRLSAEFGDAVLETNDFRGDHEARVSADKWVAAATFLRDDDATGMNQLVDLTAVDHPERGDAERFDVVLMLRSLDKGHRFRLRTRVADGAKLATLCSVYAGADWAEREIWDMFGIPFEGHPDLRRILLYEEFEGHPLRKDYPIDRAQPLVEYRQTDNIEKLAPFGIEEGQPFARINWEERLAGGDQQVSPSIAVQQGQRRNISDSEAAKLLMERLAAKRAEAEAQAGETEGGE